MATSGSFRPSSNGTYFTWTRTAFSSAGNYSDIAVTFGWGFHSSPLDRELDAGYLSVDGTVYYNVPGLVKSYEGNFTDRDYQVYANTIRIYHNSDGTKTFSVTAGMTGYSGVRVEGSPSFTLDTIPLFPGAPTGLGVTGHTDSDPTTATISWTAPSNVGAGLDDFELQVSTASDFSSTVVDVTNGSWTTSKAVSGLPKGTSLYARVRAHTAAGYGDWSSTLSFTTGTTVPNAPAGLASSNVVGTSADVTWNAPTDNGGTAITGYTVQRALNSGFSSGLVTTNLPASPRSLNITGLAHTTTYWVKVRAINAAGNSSFSSSISFTTLSTVPGAPGTPTVGSLTPTSASVSWTTPSDDGGAAITGYDVQYATDSAFTSVVATVTSTASPKALSNLSPSTNYWVRVRAKNTNGAGAWTSGTAFRTPSGLLVGNGSAWKNADVWIGDGSNWVLCRVRSGNGTGWS